MKAEEIAIFILLLGMVASSFAQVVFRLVLDHPLAWSEELSRYLFVWLSFVGGALAVAEGSHFKMDLLAALIKDQRKKIIIDIIVSIAILIFSSVFLFAQGVEEIQSDETVVKVTGVTVDSQGVAVAADQLYGLLQKCLRIVEEISTPSALSAAMYLMLCSSVIG